MSTFWFSRSNLIRVINNIMSFFTAVDQDLDEIQNSLNGLGTASTKDVPTSGNASSTQIVMGNDTRLTDSRNANDVYSWAKASTKPIYTALEVGAISSSDKGVNGGVAELDSNGKVPSSQLPSYVDDVIEGYYYNDKFYEESTYETEISGETGKIYIDLSTNKTYRWSGSVFGEISQGLVLGTTSSTAYRGDRGASAYTHASDSNKLTTATSSGLYKVASTNKGHIASLMPVEKSDITDLGIPSQDTVYTHPSYTARTGKPSANETPTFGETFTVSQIKSDATGHVTAATNRTIKIPDSEATSSSHGLMSAADKIKLTLGTHDVDGQTVEYDTVKNYVEGFVANFFNGSYGSVVVMDYLHDENGRILLDDLEAAITSAAIYIRV